jgi:hypothetical protein
MTRTPRVLTGTLDLLDALIEALKSFAVAPARTPELV